jgi:hypothetical protein
MQSERKIKLIIGTVRNNFLHFYKQKKLPKNKIWAHWSTKFLFMSGTGVVAIIFLPPPRERKLHIWTKRYSFIKRGGGGESGAACWSACLVRLEFVVEDEQLLFQGDVVALEPLVRLAQPLVSGLAKPNHRWCVYWNMRSGDIGKFHLRENMKRKIEKREIWNKKMSPIHIKGKEKQEWKNAELGK